MPSTLRTPSCACGKVVCEAAGEPILTAVCYCDDCQAAGARIEALNDAAPLRDDDGGTPLVVYRDDRFRCVAGEDLLVAHKLKDTSPTRRMVASCCNSAMFLKFAPGHWVSAYRARFEGDVPPIEMRTSVRRRRSADPLPADAPAYPGFPPQLIFRLLGARVAMWLAPSPGR